MRIVSRYLALHWLGKLPLPMSYWVNSMLLSGAALFALSSIQPILNSAFPPLKYLWTSALVLSTAAIGAWSSVGTWRSASAYSQSTDKIWGEITKCVIVFGLLRAVFEISR